MPMARGDRIFRWRRVVALSRETMHEQATRAAVDRRDRRLPRDRGGGARTLRYSPHCSRGCAGARRRRAGSSSPQARRLVRARAHSSAPWPAGSRAEERTPPAGAARNSSGRRRRTRTTPKASGASSPSSMTSSSASTRAGGKPIVTGRGLPMRCVSVCRAV